MRRKVLIVKPDGCFSTLYVEGAVTVELGHDSRVELHALGHVPWLFPVGTRLDFIELQGRDE